MNTAREALLEHALERLAQTVDETLARFGAPAQARARLRDAVADAQRLTAPPNPDGSAASRSPIWFVVESVEAWCSEAVRCPACGDRDSFWARLDVVIGPDSLPTAIWPIVQAPATRVECIRCNATASYNDFLPPWTDFKPGRCSCASASCHCPRPLTDADRADEARFMTTWYEAGLDPHKSSSDP